MMFRKVWIFIKLTRPFFLLGGALLYGLGLVIAAWQGIAINAGRAVLGQLLVTSIQLMAHYINEYYDVEVDQLIGPQRTRFSGGSGVLPAGDLPRETARMAAYSCTGVSLVVMLAASLQVPSVGLIGVVSLFGAWFYSAPPLTLMGSGLGELDVSIIVALLVPLVGYVMQAGQIAPLVLIVCLPLVPIHLAMLLTFEFPDRIADAQVNKQTLTVRFGLQRSIWLHNILLIGAFAWLALFAGPPANQLVWLAAPLALWQVIKATRSTHGVRANWQLLSFGAIALFALTSGLSLIGFVVT